MKLDIFLRIKHWQLFIYLFSIPAVMILHSMFIPGASTVNFHIVIEMIMLNLFMIIYGIWFFALGSNLEANRIKPSMSRFLSYNFMIIITYTIIMNYFVFRHFITPSAELTSEDISFFNGLVPIMITGQVYSTCLYLLTLVLFAKAFVVKESGRDAKFGEYFHIIILFIVSPIGVWILQPRINKIFR